MSTIEVKQEVKRIVNELAGSPAELTKQLKRIGLRYVKTNRGFKTLYIIRGKGINKIIIEL